MPERRTANTKKKAYFLGREYSIDLLAPPTTVRLPKHNILSNDGKDTGIQCPNTEGIVTISSLMDLNLSHRITIRCESASKPFSPKDGWVQCRNATETLIKV